MNQSVAPAPNGAGLGARAQKAVAFAIAIAPGLVLTLAMGLAGYWLAAEPWLARWQVSALTLAIVLGMLVGNGFGAALPARLAPGVIFSQQKLLRLGIILYGLRITFQDIAAIGAGGLLIDGVIVGGTLLLGTRLGRLFGLEADTALLTAGGSAICGAAAVLAMERVLRPDPGKVALAVATVVLFGTLDIFVYPALYPWLGMSVAQFGVYTGATVHEVAQVVAVGSAIGPAAADGAVIVKLTRVMLLVPVLLLLGWRGAGAGAGAGGRRRIDMPWFALLFVAVAALNSVVHLADGVREILLAIDTLALAAAMAALGLETRFAKLRALGVRPLLLAFVLWLWLMGAGYALVHVVI